MTLGSSESMPILEDMSGATEKPVWPMANSSRKSLLDSSGVLNPERRLMVQAWPRYMLGYTPRVYGGFPGSPMSLL